MGCLKLTIYDYFQGINPCEFAFIRSKTRLIYRNRENRKLLEPEKILIEAVLIPGFYCFYIDGVFKVEIS